MSLKIHGTNLGILLSNMFVQEGNMGESKLSNVNGSMT